MLCMYNVTVSFNHSVKQDFLCKLLDLILDVALTCLTGREQREEQEVFV